MNELAKFIYQAIVEKETSKQGQLPLENQDALKDLDGLLAAPPREVAEHLQNSVRPEPWPTFRTGEPVPTHS